MYIDPYNSCLYSNIHMHPVYSSGDTVTKNKKKRATSNAKQSNKQANIQPCFHDILMQQYNYDNSKGLYFDRRA